MVMESSVNILLIKINNSTKVLFNYNFLLFLFQMDLEAVPEICCRQYITR